MRIFLGCLSYAVIAWLGMPGNGFAQALSVSIAEEGAAVPFATFHCSPTVICGGPAVANLGDARIPLEFAIEVFPPDQVEFKSILCEEAPCRVILNRDGGGRFGVGGAAGTLWVISGRPLRNPVLRQEPNALVGRVTVTVRPDRTKPATEGEVTRSQGL